jgi:hypothetical protein
MSRNPKGSTACTGITLHKRQQVNENISAEVGNTVTCKIHSFPINSKLGLTRRPNPPGAEEELISCR